MAGEVGGADDELRRCARAVAETSGAIAARIERLKELAGGTQADLQRATGLSEPTLRSWAAGDIPEQRSSPTPAAFDQWVDQALRDATSDQRRVELRAVAVPTFVELAQRYRDAVDARDALGHGAPEADADGGDGAGEGVGVDDLSDDAARAAPRSQRPRVVAVVLITLVALAAVVAVVAWIFRPGSDEPGSSSGTSPVPVSAQLVLDQTNFCAWVLGSHPIPLVSRDPLVMRVDARCNNPPNPDPVADIGVTVYSVPSNDDGTKLVTHVKDGESVVPVCFELDGEEVGDIADPPNSSSIWIKLDRPAGYVPNVNLGGGYTEEQLRELGLDDCG